MESACLTGCKTHATFPYSDHKGTFAHYVKSNRNTNISSTDIYIANNIVRDKILVHLTGQELHVLKCIFTWLCRRLNPLWC